MLEKRFKMEAKKNKKLNISYLILFIISLGITLLFFYSLFKLNIVEALSDAITKPLSADYKLNIITLYAILLFLVLYTFGYVIYAIGGLEKKICKNNKKLNPYSIIAILSILWVILIGIIGYASLFNQEDFSFYLRNENSTVSGNITCTGPSQTILQGQSANCTIYPKLNNITAKIQFDEENGNYTTQNLSELKFVAPYKKIIYIKIYISGINNENKITNLNVGNEYFFPNITDYRKNALAFFKFLAILFGIAFISIPTAIYYLRQIIENRG